MLKTPAEQSEPVEDRLAPSFYRVGCSCAGRQQQDDAGGREEPPGYGGAYHSAAAILSRSGMS